MDSYRVHCRAFGLYTVEVYDLFELFVALCEAKIQGFL